jgi:hypothetical protein
MRARLQKYLPIFMIALMVQILAPIGAGWAFAAAISDPLAAAEICQTGPSSNGNDQGGQHRTHDASCVLCCSFNASTVTFSAPEPTAWAAPYRLANGIIWQCSVPQLADSCIDSNAKARAPPFTS